MASTNDLSSFLRAQNVATLADLLLELAARHEHVMERLERLQLQRSPAKLAAAFRKRLTAWKRSRRFVEYRAAAAYANERSAWLAQIEIELLPLDPAATVALAEAYIEADATWFEQSDDSDGHVGDTVHEACRLWLTAAAQCETPRGEWPERIAGLYLADEYGAREELLRSANLLLNDADIGQLIASFEERLAKTHARRDARGHVPAEFYRSSAAVKLLSQALRNPDAHVRAVLSHSPKPNPLQMEDLAKSYLEAGRPADALTWLQGDWGHHEGTRERLLAQTYEELQRPADSAPIRRSIFERSLAHEDLQAWLRNLPKAEHAAAREHACQRATSSDRPIAAATLLLHLGQAAGADQLMVDRQALVDGRDYYSLEQLARKLAGVGCWRAATVGYRALLTNILDRAHAKAYGHAAAYWHALNHIAAEQPLLDGLTPHPVFTERIRKDHVRKVAFWARVREAHGAANNAAKQDEDDEPDVLQEDDDE